jgi:hypothetical protein
MNTLRLLIVTAMAVFSLGSRHQSDKALSSPYQPTIATTGSHTTIHQGACPTPPWGFFGHKRINRLAVLTLPPEMMVFFKTNIDWLSDHAVDPDMRRYASKHEGPRHFIDLDIYESLPPRSWPEAMAAKTTIYLVTASSDTLTLIGESNAILEKRQWSEAVQKAYRTYFVDYVFPAFYAEEAELDIETLRAFLSENGLDTKALDAASAVFFVENMSEHGVLPWNLQSMQNRLKAAFEAKDAKKILRTAAEMGHYIGDAHVPLHTTSNYNGQKTGQHGIHGFWESRIPELFADEQYDYFVGKPKYISNTRDFFWETVLDSHKMADSVLSIERDLRLRFPPDRQTCPDVRNGFTIIAPCREFANAYQVAMNGMVERRFRAAIQAVASAWFTAWVDAKTPDLSDMKLLEVANEKEKQDALQMQKMFEGGKIIGRPEEN